MVIYRSDFLENETDRLFSEFLESDGELEQKEFGKKQKQKAKLDRFLKNQIMHQNRANKKAAAAEEAMIKAEEALKVGDTKAAENYTKAAEFAENKSKKAATASSQAGAMADNMANKIGKDTPFVKDANGVETRTITGRNGGSVTQTKRNLPKQGSGNNRGGNSKKARTLADKIKEEGRQKNKNIAIVETTHNYQPTSAKAPSKKINTGGVTQTKSTKLVNVVTNNVGNEVISTSPAAATPKYKIRSALIGEGYVSAPLNRNLDPNKVAENAKRVLAEREAAELARKKAAEEAAEEAARQAKERAAREAEEAARRKAEELARKKTEEAAKSKTQTAVKEAAPGFLKRNKKALMIGTGIAGLGGLGYAGYRKYKNSREE